MTPFPPAARRPLVLGCGLLAALALLLPGCGEEGKAAPESAAAGQARVPGGERPAGPNRAKGGVPASSPTAAGCPRQLATFIGKLRTLRRQLAVGLNYDQYTAAVEDLRASYDAIPVKRLALACLAAAGTPAEDALNKYIDGVNAWGACLADASCTTATIEPVLQRKWRVASRHLSEAQ